MSVESDILPIMSSKILREGIWDEVILNEITEIRIRVGRPIFLWYGKKEVILTKHNGELLIAEKGDLIQIMERITNYSLYAFENEISEGFITIKGGHRIGICGKCVSKNGKILNQCDVMSLNIRIAHQIIGCADRILMYLFDSNQNLWNTLIFSAPGNGKTTLLRECIRQISTGFKDFNGKNVAVVDERMEIGANYFGELQNDLGVRTDVICGGKKTEALSILLRTMAPDVIAVDEIGSVEDFKQIKECSKCGVNIIATMHRSEIDELKDIISTDIFKRFICLKYNNSNFIGTVYDSKMKILWEGSL